MLLCCIVQASLQQFEHPKQFLPEPTLPQSKQLQAEADLEPESCADASIRIPWGQHTTPLTRPAKLEYGVAE